KPVAGASAPPERWARRLVLPAAAAAGIAAAVAVGLLLAPRVRQAGSPAAAGTAATAGGRAVLAAGGARPAIQSRPGRPVTLPAGTIPLPAGIERLLWQAWEPPSTSRLNGSAAGVSPAGGPGDVAEPLPAVEEPRLHRRRVERGIYGVYDESSGDIYLLGVDRLRTEVQAVHADL
ncbi:MAG: hypothetical protein J7M21_00285, partial [Planctomycetes bacterium]|nr:hypothetical protein [Planctomycetota bacterium]